MKKEPTFFMALPATEREKLREKQKPGAAVKGGSGQVQGRRPCRGSRVAQTLAGRDRAKTCALVKKRAGTAEKVPQNRPHIIG